MRRGFIAGVGVLAVCGLVWLGALRSGGPGVAEEHAAATRSGEAPTGPTRPAVRSSAQGPALSSPRAPEVSDGLEVEVLGGATPVPGAEVRLYQREAGGDSSGVGPWRRVGSGFTDSTGRVRLASAPGGYLVAVRAPGHAPLLRDVVRPQGEALTSLRVLLEPGHSLVGRTVVARTNEPLPLVELSFTAHARELEPWQRADAPDEERVLLHSDERGNFRVDGLSPGTYLLEAQAPGHARASVSRLRVPVEGPLTVALRLAGVIEGFVVDAQEQPVANAEVLVGGSPSLGVTTGARGGFSAEVEPGPHAVSARRGEEAGALDTPLLVPAGGTVRDVRIRLGAGARLEGQVVEKRSRAAVAGARVELSAAQGQGARGDALSDAQGHFEVRGLPPGSYTAKVSAPGFVPTLRRNLTLAQGERFPVEVALARAGGVLEGRVSESTGAPLANVRVEAIPVLRDVPGTALTEARTDAEGHYRLDGLAPGPLSVLARREGATMGVRQSVDVGEEGLSRLDFTLEGLGTVEGRVRGALAASGLEVAAHGRGRPGQPGSIGRGLVSPEGTFRLVLPANTYTLMLSEREHVSAWQQQVVSVEEGRTVQVDFSWEERPPNDCRGVVLEPDGTPSPGAFVTLLDAEGRGMPMGTAAADDEGRFVLTIPQMGNAAKVATVVVARQGGRASERVPVEAGQDVVVRLRPGASLRGRVLREGSPVRGFTLSLVPRQGLFTQDVGPWEFPGERYELRDVPAEPFTVMAWTADGERGEALVSSGMGAALDVDIVLKPMATVRGRVVDATTRAPVPEAYVFLEGEPSWGLEAAPDAQGRFSLSKVRAGEHVLVVLGPGPGRVSRTLRVAQGEVMDVGDVALEQGAPAPPPP